MLSEGLPCILDIGKCLIEIGCNFLWALPAPMAAAGAPLTIQYDLSTTVPSFQSVWHAPPNGRLTSKHAKRILLMCARAKATTKCCSHDCLSAFRKKEMLKKAARWRMQWHKLSRRQRRQVLLDYLRKKHVHQASMESVASMDDDAGAHGICGQGRNVYTRERAFGGNPKTYRQHKFLNVQMCSAAWRLLTGVSGNVHCRTNRKRLLGHTCSPAAKISRPSHVADAMHGAVMSLCLHLRERMPFKHHNEDHIDLPISRKYQLFGMLQSWYDERATGLEPLLPKPPNIWTFRQVLATADFRKVRFHRVVDIGRCSKCCFFNWKALVAGTEHKAVWEKLAAQHQWLQLSQKHAYSRDRVRAANTFPSRDGELYFGIDGGSGFDCHLPHFSGYALEVPTKKLQNHHTLPFKLMNGLVHGDSRSHVLLSSGSVVAVPQ